MSVENTILERHSVRAFLPDPVPRKTLEHIFSIALQSPSNCNVQPWHLYVVSGAARDQLSEALIAEVSSGKAPYHDFHWESNYEGDMRERQVDAAAALYNAMGIERGDKQGRTQAMLRNWEFFGAPHAVFFTIEKQLQFMGAVDTGIFAQTLSLLMAEYGIGTCIQGALNFYPGPVRKICNVPENNGVLLGMSFGYKDHAHPANTARTSRKPLAKLVTYVE